MSTPLAVCSWSLLPNSSRELIESVRDCGLSRVQIALDPFIRGDWDPEPFTHLTDSSGIELVSGMMTTLGEDYSTLETIRSTGGLVPDERWEANQRRAAASASAARALNLTLVTFHAGFIPNDDPETFNTMADRISAIAAIFADQGVRIALETGQEDTGTLLKLLKDPRLDGVGVNFDPANLILYGTDEPKAAMDLLADRIVQVHMKDATRTPVPGSWGVEVPAGDGEVDWAHFLSLADRLAVGIVIERESGDRRIQDVIAAKGLALAHLKGSGT